MVSLCLQTSPRIYDYIDPVEFIKSQFSFIKSKDPQMTVRTWASQMGLDSPDLLIALLKGKKPIRPRHFSLLKRALHLDDSEETYFQTIVLRKAARTTEERAVFDRILASLSPGKNISTAITEDVDVFSSWAILAVMFALEIPELRSESRLVHAFREKLTPANVKECLDLLLAKGLISQDKNGFLPCQQQVSSPTDKPIEGIHSYYLQVLELAKSAIPMDVRTREFQCFSLTIDTDDLETFKQMIRDLRTKMISRSVHTLRSNAVYQTGIHFFPLAEVAKQDKLGLRGTKLDAPR